MKLLLAVFLGLLAAVSSSPVKSLKQDFVEYSADLVEKINSMDTTWRAGRHFAGETAASVLDRFSTAGLSLEKAPKLPVVEYDRAGAIPTEFDARTKWPNCPSIGRVNDQGRCRASWAFSAVGAMTDRQCIVHPSAPFNYSVTDAVTCNVFHEVPDGCAGGYSADAWSTWVLDGLVSGGGYHTSNGCRPYAYKPCDHYETGSYGPCESPPDSTYCNKTCINGYTKTYAEDKKKGDYRYDLPLNETIIQEDIMTSGPVSADMNLYQDFLNYRSGVYQHKTETRVGLLTVKIIGWGVENNQKYWLCVNSWNSEWGDKGLVKILRGTDECGLEANVHAGKVIQ
ncbi:cathepsin B-like cysteine proteinase 3 [Patiria miniata]|uniref:Peptidase C1A papain C-terminal domain-containing protein n=1 Tax=Patiria miniata TaxID=46514 RepID=A0A913ZJB4_PATMI|nr:cathepsin B-like cysteine proteinase 3 [Patiria miniata]